VIEGIGNGQADFRQTVIFSGDFRFDDDRSRRRSQPAHSGTDFILEEKKKKKHSVGPTDPRPGASSRRRAKARKKAVSEWKVDPRNIDFGPKGFLNHRSANSGDGRR